MTTRLNDAATAATQTFSIAMVMLLAAVVIFGLTAPWWVWPAVAATAGLAIGGVMWRLSR